MPATTGSAAPAARRPVILLVEDEVGIRDAFALLLEIEGYAVRTAVDGMDALDVLARGSVDLVISDYRMPRLDGVGLAATLRQRLGPTVPPIVLITAAMNSAELTAAADVVLVKPVDVNRLLRTVRRLLGQD